MSMDKHPEIKRNLQELGVNVFSIKMDRELKSFQKYWFD